MRTVVGVLCLGLIAVSGTVVGAAEAQPETWVGRWVAEEHWQEFGFGKLGLVSSGGRVEEPWTVELTPTKLVEAGRTLQYRGVVESGPDGAKWIEFCSRTIRRVLNCEHIYVRVTSGGRLVLRREGEGMLMRWTYYRRCDEIQERPR
ncbi:MAG TPA: hypothetical protein VGU19_10255 [Microvirga sp.]|jgi:hypothetical protein|nr:hypothetical protein [Microvirga sp.]